MTIAQIAVTIAYAAPGVEVLVDVRLNPGACVGDAVAQSGIVPTLAVDPAQLEFAIFGQRVRDDTPLRDGDRVELTRPLVADPKRNRRARAARNNAANPAGPKGNKR